MVRASELLLKPGAARSRFRSIRRAIRRGGSDDEQRAAIRL